MPQRPRPIPDEFRAITPHIVVRGAAKAIEFYRRAFGADELYRSTTPDGKAVMHCELLIGDARLFLVDEIPEWRSLSPTSLGGTPVTLHLYVDDADAAYDRAIQAGALMVMPPNDGFWGERYGIVRDPFGHVWALASRLEDLAPHEITRRAAAAMAEDAASPTPRRRGARGTSTKRNRK